MLVYVGSGMNVQSQLGHHTVNKLSGTNTVSE